MHEITLEFHECEHEGDLDHYIDDLPRCKVISTNINKSAEIGTVVIRVHDRKKFWDEFRETEAYEFLK